MTHDIPPETSLGAPCPMESKSDGDKIMKTGLRVALFVWGDLIEDFLDSIGLSLEDYTQIGWLVIWIRRCAEAG